MSDHFSQLEAALSDATIREYADHGRSRTPADDLLRPNALRRIRWASPRSWPAIAVIAAVLAFVATAAAAIVVLSEHRSEPLTGTVPVLRLLHYDVSVTPDLEAGDVGWCSVPRFSISGVPAPLSGGGTCAPAYLPGSPVVLAGGEPLSNAIGLLRAAHVQVSRRQGQTNLFWAVVTARVAAMRLRPGLVVRARFDPRLAAGWKAVVVFVSGQLDPVALDLAGHVIHEAGAVQQIIQTSVRKYTPAVSAKSSPCVIRPPRLAWVTASWGVLATSAPRLGAKVEPNVLFSCARSWYSVKGSTAAPSAALLLNAHDPHRLAPAPPGLRATAQAGVFIEDGGASGPILATRRGRAWLVVQSPSVQVDAALLHAIRTEGSDLPQRVQ